MRHGDFFWRQKKSEARRATEEDSMYPAPYDCLGSRDRRALGSGMSGWRQTSVFSVVVHWENVRSAPFLTLCIRQKLSFCLTTPSLQHPSWSCLSLEVFAQRSAEWGNRVVGSLCAKSTSFSSLGSSLRVPHSAPSFPRRRGLELCLCASRAGRGCKQRILSDAWLPPAWRPALTPPGLVAVRNHRSAGSGETKRLARGTRKVRVLAAPPSVVPAGGQHHGQRRRPRERQHLHRSPHTPFRLLPST